MRTGSKKYRLIQRELDDAGFMTLILRVDKKWYEYHVNGNIEKKYKKRHSCNNRLLKLYNEKCQKNHC